MSTSLHKNLFIAFSILLASIIVAVFILKISNAQTDNLNFPISELGNCSNKEDCKKYCDQKENLEKCVNFAEKNNLMTNTEIKDSRKTIKALKQKDGPGGCSSQEACENYCDDTNNIDECLIFAEKHEVMDPEELQEARKIAQALKHGIKLPGGCKNKKSCESYCKTDTHFDECFAFAEAAGFITKEEAKIVKKTGGKGPGGCRGEKECKNYCDSEKNFDICISFAEIHDLIDAKELKIIKKTGGKGPGGCRGEQQCRTYCDDLAHMEDCINFAVEIGDIPQKEAEKAKIMAQKGIRGGPGGCKGKEECENFCNQPNNTDQCVIFAVEIGEMTQEEAEKIKKMGNSLRENGPGGCRGKEECENFCNDPANENVCMDFAVKQGFMSQEEKEQAHNFREGIKRDGPLGCQGEKECRDFCEDPSHQEECKRFSDEHNITREKNPKENFQKSPDEEPKNHNKCRGLSPEECRAIICSDPTNAEKCPKDTPPKSEYKEGFINKEYRKEFRNEENQYTPTRDPREYKQLEHTQKSTQHNNEPINIGNPIDTKKERSTYQEPTNIEKYHQEPASSYQEPNKYNSPPDARSVSPIGGNLLNAAKKLLNKLTNILNK